MTIQIGILGTSRQSLETIISPSSALENVALAAIASRDRMRAQRFSKRFNIPGIHADYLDLIEDPGVDLVYIALPTGLNCDWGVAALERGKHVMIEAPLAANSDEADRLYRAAQQQQRLLWVSRPYRYHPLFDTLVDILDANAAQWKIQAALQHNAWNPFGFRYNYPLAGGAMLNLGNHLAYYLCALGSQCSDPVLQRPPVVAKAQAQSVGSGRRRWIDRRADAQLSWDKQHNADLHCELRSWYPFRNKLLIEGSSSTVEIDHFLNPRGEHNIRVIKPGGSDSLNVHAEHSAALLQLQALVDRCMARDFNNVEEALERDTMALVDLVYGTAGLRARGHFHAGKDAV